VKVWPATVSVPVLGTPSPFTAAVNVMLPLPVPDAALVIVSHAAFETAVQEQPAPLAVTVTEPLPPAAAKS
jgi:hypothetical protein